MKTWKFHFPGDPVEEVVEYTVHEFLDRFPRSMQIITEAGVENAYVPPCLILCDVCGNQVTGDQIISVVRDSRGYCAACVQEYLNPYRMKEKEGKDEK